MSERDNNLNPENVVGGSNSRPLLPVWLVSSDKPWIPPASDQALPPPATIVTNLDHPWLPPMVGLNDSPISLPDVGLDGSDSPKVGVSDLRSSQIPWPAPGDSTGWNVEPPVLGSDRTGEKPGGDNKATKYFLGVHDAEQLSWGELKVAVLTGKCEDDNAQGQIKTNEESIAEKAAKFAIQIPSLQSLQSDGWTALSKKVSDAFGTDVKRTVGLNEKGEVNLKIDLENGPGQAELTFPLGLPGLGGFRISDQGSGIGLHQDFDIPSSPPFKLKGEVSMFPVVGGTIPQEAINQQDELSQKGQQLTQWLLDHASEWKAQGYDRAKIAEQVKTIYGAEVSCTCGYNAEHKPSIIITVDHKPAEAQVEIVIEEGDWKRDDHNKVPPIVGANIDDDLGGPGKPPPGTPRPGTSGMPGPGTPGPGTPTPPPFAGPGGSGGIRVPLEFPHLPTNPFHVDTPGTASKSDQVWQYIKDHPWLAVGAVATSALILHKIIPLNAAGEIIVESGEPEKGLVKGALGDDVKTALDADGKGLKPGPLRPGTKPGPFMPDPTTAATAAGLAADGEVGGSAAELAAKARSELIARAEQAAKGGPGREAALGTDSKLGIDSDLNAKDQLGRGAANVPGHGNHNLGTVRAAAARLDTVPPGDMVGDIEGPAIRFEASPGAAADSLTLSKAGTIDGQMEVAHSRISALINNFSKGTISRDELEKALRELLAEQNAATGTATTVAGETAS